MIQRRTLAQWRSTIADQEQSGLSVAAYCRRENLNAKGFYLARSKLKRYSPFVEATPSPSKAPCAMTVKTSHVEMYIPTDACPNWVAQVISGVIR